MKSLLLQPTLILFGFTAMGQANTALSNLTSPTAVNQHLQPSSSNTRDLGSLSRAWRDLKIRGSVYIDSALFISNNPGIRSMNTFIGSNSGRSITTGTSNTSLGHASLSRTSTGTGNIAIGSEALTNNSTGFTNVAIGDAALLNNTTGFYNIALGKQSLMFNNGSGNIAIGVASMPYISSGRYNIGIGANSLMQTTTAEYNTAIGSLSGNSYNNGYNNVFVGANTDVNGSGYYNVIAIGQATICTAPSQVTIGNPATNSYRTYANWSNISDGRFKQHIQEDVKGLEFINKLRPVSYQLKARELDKFLNNGLTKIDDMGVDARSSMEKALQEKETAMHTGFVAQEVESAAKELGFKFSGVEAPVNEKDVYALRYTDFIVPLVKAVQELDRKTNQIDQLKELIDHQQQQINDLKNMIDKLVNGQNGNNTNLSSSTISQNKPNPFSRSTTIEYSIPSDVSNAQVYISDIKGTQIKIISLNKGNDKVTINGDELAAGTYIYSLWVDGKQVESKKMTLSR